MFYVAILLSVRTARNNVYWFGFVLH